MFDLPIGGGFDRPHEGCVNRRAIRRMHPVHDRGQAGMKGRGVSLKNAMGLL